MQTAFACSSSLARLFFCPFPRFKVFQKHHRLFTTAVTDMKSFYRRALPPSLTPFHSDSGKLLFKAAIDSGFGEVYFHLVGNFTSQSDPAFCGLGSLAMVLNALEMDPGRTWKGVWRWYSDEMLDCCAPLERVRQKGITFPEFACLAKCNGLFVESKRCDKTTQEEFERDIKAVCASEDKHMVISFDRATLSQTGVGHFSPIGAFDPQSNMALVLDVARFKYPSYWASVDMLWKAMQPVDKDTGKPRGYFILSRADVATSFHLIRVNEAMSDYHTSTNTRLLAFKRVLDYSPPTSLAALLALLRSSFLCSSHLQPEACSFFPLSFGECGIDLTGPGLVAEFNQDMAKLKREIGQHPIMHSLEPLVSDIQDFDVLFALLVICLPEELFSSVPSSVLRQFEALRDSSGLSSVARKEIRRINDQLSILNNYCVCHSKLKPRCSPPPPSLDE